jgi:Type IV secretion system pilin
MTTLIKYTLLTICTSIIVMWGFALISSQTHADDLLETAFKPAKQFDYVINPGTTRDSVGKAFLRNSYTIWGKSVKDPIVVRLIKWLLEIIVIIWVPLLIFGGIKYITAAGDEWAQKTARTWMINVVIGIVLALSSLAIVTFVSSLLNDSRFWQDFADNAASAPTNTVPANPGGWWWAPTIPKTNQPR